MTDFIQLILYYVERSTSLDQALQEIEELTIERLRELELNVIKCLPPNQITIDPMDSLMKASSILDNNRLHRLPVVEHANNADNILTVLTQNKILRFVARNNLDPVLWATTLGDTKIGKYHNVTTGTPETPLIDILKLFINKSISAVPILDKDGTIID